MMFPLRLFGWMCCLVLALIGLARPLWATHVGFFVFPDHHWGFGILADTNGAQELLGQWVSPLSFGLASLLWLAVDRTEAYH